MAVNKVFLIGNLGNDPEMREMPSGGSVANFSIATSERWKDKQTGEQKEKTEWHRISAFGRLAEICGEYLKKGSQVCIIGKLQTRKWEKEGQTHYTTEIIANEMQMLGGRDRGDVDGPPPMSARDAALAAAHGSAPKGEPEFDDDIPF